ncbi:MAG TPA: acetylornithine transaminase [Capsulimonadaceae bacterium]|nr:acetylornithine transaminase [Capsulimonadaceae bacterium]
MPLDLEEIKLSDKDDITSDHVKAWDEQYVMHTYARQPVIFTRGFGARLWDIEGKEYLDFLAGIAVDSLGHCHPNVVRAVQDQAATLIHTSNLYFTVPQARLAKKLCEISGQEKVFFCNSGAEANEAALKIARKHGKRAGDQKFKIITATGSFHGRTMGTVTATAQPKYQDPFRPLVPGFEYVQFNDIDALTKAVDDETCAVMLEPIQGETGINVATPAFLQAARDLCDRHGALLIFDEVQTGVGRTGKWWAHETYGVKPDIMTLAKGLGGGLPIGVCLSHGDAASTLVPGDHGSTFAANPLATSAALAVLETIEQDGLKDNAHRVGEYFMERLRSAPFAGAISEVRGRGLMIGAQLNEPMAKKIVAESLNLGLVINGIGDHILRFLPPLIINDQDADEAVDLLGQALSKALDEGGKT